MSDVGSLDLSTSTAKDEPLISLRSITMSFRQQTVLRDLDINITRGETLCIIGESGCGKTVLLKLMIALLKPTQGTVLFDGKNLAKLKEHELTQVRLRFGFGEVGRAHLGRPGQEPQGGPHEQPPRTPHRCWPFNPTRR